MIEPAFDRLFNLLPSIYRQRDISQGDALRSLMAVMESELQFLEADIQGLYENWFIETCDEWVVPYLADLLGVRGLGEKQSAILSQRARVANTISASRRKGTVAALERLIHDSTGWGVKVVESFEQLASTQQVRHVRMGRGTTFDVRQARAGADSPFSLSAHTPDPCGAAGSPTKYNTPNLGIHLWRLQAYPVMRSRARAVSQPADGRFSFDPLGHDMPLFNRPKTGTDFSPTTGALNVPLPIPPEAFAQDLAAYRQRYGLVFPEHRPANSDFYGPQRSLDIVRVDKNRGEKERYNPVTPMEIVAMDLSSWEQPPDGKVAVDVRLGRLRFSESERPHRRVQVNYTYGFSADMGGGPYDRRLTLAEPGPNTLQIPLSKNAQSTASHSSIDQRPTSLQEALKTWRKKGRPNAIIQILDNDSYGGSLVIDLKAGNQLVIEAADGVRPSLRLFSNLKVIAPPGENARLVLNGLLLEGKIEIEGDPTLAITHCTLAPGRRMDNKGNPVYPDWDVLVAGLGKGQPEVTISNSIVGPLRLSAGCRKLSIQDSIVDAPAVHGQARPAIAADDTGADGPPTSIERCTLFGAVSVTELTLASESIFTAPVRATSDQGCVRYSYVPLESSTPARFRCQPDLALTQLTRESTLPDAEKRLLVGARLQPRFSSTRYGDPAYAQLRPNCAPELRAGADDDSEMGAFHHLYQAQRETTLRLVLDETLRFGLEAGLFYET